MRTFRLAALGFAALTLGLVLARASHAGDVIYPSLNPATTVQDTDLLATWRASGPLTKVQASVLNAYIQSKLNPVYAQTANNLSDLANAATARTNLGLGSAATQNTGTSGNVLCLLNANCIISGTRQFNAQVTFDAQVNLAAPIVPSGGNGIQGTTAADNANAGIVGEYQSASFSNVTVSGTLNLTSMTLSAGDWDVQGASTYSDTPNSLTNCVAGVSTTSANFGPPGSYQQFWFVSSGPQILTAVTPSVRVNVSTSTTIYLAGVCGATAGTVAASGMMRARRVR